MVYISEFTGAWSSLISCRSGNDIPLPEYAKQGKRLLHNFQFNTTVIGTALFGVIGVDRLGQAISSCA